MSGRLVSTTRLKHRAATLIAFAVLGGFACGLLAVAVAPVHAQPVPVPVPAPKEKEPGDAIDEIDKRDPLPADGPRHKARERLQIPGRQRAIFAEVEDFKPVARQDVNPREYDAWIEFVLHTKNQNARDLDEYAIRDLVPLDFTNMARAKYRTELIRFDGKLSCVRRLVSPRQLRENGISELYEARFVPLDESPVTPVSIVFIDLPESLASVKNIKPEEWLDADGWVTASGYYFKTMSVPGERANAVVSIPLLIGKGLTPLPGPPVPSPNPTALDKNIRVYKFIKDEAKMIRNNPNEVSWPEVAAYNRIILHASRFTAEQLEEHSNTELKFADLFEDGRTAHKLSCVRFEGRLISLKRVEVKDNDWLSAAGVTQVFEGWLIPKDEPRGNPIVIQFTEPLADVEPTGRVNKWVSFAGYSFKKMRYESQEKDPKNPSKNLDKYAPLLIGRKPIARHDPDTPTSVTWGVFINAAMLGGALLILCGGAFALYYRGGDRKAKAEMDAVRHRNPFDPPAA